MKKTRTGASLIVHLFKQLNDPNRLLHKLWSSYVIPSALYGSEITQVTQDYMKAIDTISKGVIRDVYNLPHYTANAGLLITTGMPLTELSITKIKLQFLYFVRALPKSRWITQTLAVQKQWAIEDGWIDNDWKLLHPIPLNNPTTWLQQTLCLAQMSQIPTEMTFNKEEMKLIIKGENNRRVMAMKDECSTLRWLDDNYDEIDNKLNLWKHIWWIKARLGGIFLQQRYCDVELWCPLCNVEKEDMPHFLIRCIPNPTKLSMTIPRGVDKTTWLLSKDRSEMERSMISIYIRKRWESRKHLRETKETVGGVIQHNEE